MRKLFFLFLLLFPIPACSQSPGKADAIKCGADQTEAYIPLLQGKRIAVMANQTSRVGKCHLVDTLVSSGIEVVTIFSAEHGFIGNAADGQLIGDSADLRTGIRIVSLYGNNRKPLPEDLKNIDIVVFDIQDVGVRFYTYISSMHYLMEACAENGKEFLLLDRPDPNGSYIDGPVLERGFESFVGMHPIPVVHGLTVAELARMINGEGWLKNGIKCRLSWIPCKNYSHSSKFIPPVPPSPNLPGIQAIRLYPSLALFEGTVVSEGRGTDFPFQVFGFPGFSGGNIKFTPVSRPGISLHPKFENMECTGLDLRNYVPPGGEWNGLNLEWLMAAYQAYPEKQNFFRPYFDKLAGTDRLRKDIESGIDIYTIKKGWEPELAKYREIRQKYVLYN